MFAFRKNYFFIALALLAIEVCIAFFVRDHFVRPYVGDFLAVILIYCTIKTFFNTPPLTGAIFVLFFSFAVEVSQYFGLIHYLHLDQNRAALLIFGEKFQWVDFLAYTLGILLVLYAEGIKSKQIKRME